LAETLNDSPTDAVVVVELGGHMSRSVRRLLTDIRPIIASRGISLIAVTERRMPWLSVHGPDYVSSPLDLWEPARVSASSAMPEQAWRRLVAVSGGLPAVLTDVLDAADVWPMDAIMDGLEVSEGLLPMFDRLTARLVSLASPAQRGALDMCAALGYWHPQLCADHVAADDLRPWVVPLECGWGWLRPIWLRALQCALAGTAGGRYHFSSAGHPTPRTSPLPHSPWERASSPGSVEARLFGSFELRMDRTTVTWSGQRGVSVLRYLLASRRHTCARDQLIDQFWPETPPEAARNRLQVAVSGLRQGVRDRTPVQLIEYTNGGYRINPNLRLWVDVEQFEKAIATGRAAERSGDTEAALAAYREALELYRGDFASDAPFEQWTLLPRESLRLTYLDALDRSSRILLNMGRLDDCIAIAHRMLETDPCREDTHRLLMQCYARQGRPYLALRQYEMCSRVLRVTLSTDPAPETTRLAALIRAGGRPRDSLLR
jgi:DNA-binding SARP family transcriptional activator